MKPGVLFHAINGVGLGHLARAVSLGREAQRLGHPVLVLTNATDTTLAARAGLDHVALPPRLGEPHASPERSLEALDEQTERACACAVVDAFAPGLVVFDTHPPPWLVRHARGRGARAALVLRELRPAHLERLLRGDLLLDFDRVLLPHDPGEFSAEALPWFVPAAARGPVLRPLDPRPLAPGPPRPLLVAVAGGGGQPLDAARYVQAVADAHWLLRPSFPSLSTVILAGPYGRPPRRLPPGVQVLGAVACAESWLAAADLVIAQAGYNTVAELRALGCPAVLVPGRRRAEDQRARALRLVRAGAAVLAPPDASSLADAASALLADPARRAAMARAHARSPLAPRNAEAASWLLGSLASEPAPDAPRVVLVAHAYPPQLGGMETAAHQLARALAARGARVFVYTAWRHGAPSDPGVTVRMLYTREAPPASLDFWPDLLLTLAAAGRDAPHAIHLCNGALSPWAPLLRAALPCAVTVNVHGNDLVSPWTRHGASDPAPALARGLASASAVLAVSRFAASLASRAGAPAPRVVYGGVEAAAFDPSTTEPAALAGVDPAAPVVLTVARLSPRKGHATVIRALPSLLRRFPSLRYVFTGAPCPLLDDLRALARSLGVEAALAPAGRVEPAELPGLYRRASAFVLAPDADERDVEGFGLALLEAAAAGLPVVTSRSGGAPEAAPGADLIEPGDHRALASALRRLLDDPAAARARGLAARRSVVERFSWERTADQHLDAFAWREPRSVAPWPEPSPLPAPDEPLPEHAARARSLALAAASGPSLLRAARAFAAEAWDARLARRARYRASAAAGKTVRLRATGDGLRRLPEALDDCEAAGHRPAVEMKLAAALDPLFVAHALPRVGSLLLLHSVPSPDPASLLARLAALPPAALRLIASLRLFPSHEASATLLASARPEIEALAALLAPLGIPVVPPPDPVVPPPDPPEPAPCP